MKWFHRCNFFSDVAASAMCVKRTEVSDSCVSVCLMDVFDAPLLILLLLVAVRADLRVVVVAASHDVQYLSGGPVPDGVALHGPLLGGAAVERLKTHPVTARLYSESKVKQSKVTGYSSSQHASPLLELTGHMGSHSVTCHQAEVTFQPLPQPKLVLDLATPEGCKAELT